MIVLDQYENVFYDLDKMTSVFATEEGEVHALGYACDTAFILGKYKSHERAQEIVKEIFALYTAESRYTMPIV